MVDRYSSRVGVSGGTSYGTPYVAPTLLQGATDALLAAGHDIQKEREQQKLIDYKTAEASAEQALMIKQAELQEKIQSGKYSGAVEEYNEYFTKTMDGLRDQIDDQDYYRDSVNRFSTAYTRNLLQVKSAAGQARKQNLVGSIANKLDLLSDQYLTADDNQKNMIIGEAGRHYSDLVNLGMKSTGEAEMDMRGFIEGAESNRIAAIAKYNPELALSSLEEVQGQSGIFDELSYQTKKAEIKSIIKRSKEKVSGIQKLYMEFSETPSAMSQKDVDTFYETTINAKQKEGALDFATEHQLAVTVANETGKVPYRVLSNAMSFINIDPKDITPEVAERAKNYSGIIMAMNPVVRQSIGIDNLARATYLNRLVKIGIPATEAASRVASLDVVTVGDADRREISSKVMSGSYKARIDFLKSPLPASMKRSVVELATFYRAAGEDVGKSIKLADAQIRETSGEFLGRATHMPPNKVFNVPAEEAEGLIKKKLKSFYRDMFKSDGMSSTQATVAAEKEVRKSYLVPTDRTVNAINSGDLDRVEWLLYRDVEYGKDVVLPETRGEVVVLSPSDFKRPDIVKQNVSRQLSSSAESYTDTPYEANLLRQNILGGINQKVGIDGDN